MRDTLEKTCGAPSLSLMGTIAVRCREERQHLPLAGSTRRLFTLLGGHANHALRRDRVLDTIWPNRPDARACSALNSAVWRIKQVLAAYPGLAIEVIDDTLRLSVRAPARVDAHELEAAVVATGQRRGDCRLGDEQRARLQAALADCRGGFLEDCSEHWVLPLRELYAAYHVQAMSILLRDAAAARDYETALIHGRNILELDSFREGTQRQVMWLYALNGQRARAIRQFQALEDLLLKELSIAPMPETQSLFRRIVEATHSLSTDVEHLLSSDWPLDHAGPRQSADDTRY